MRKCSRRPSGRPKLLALLLLVSIGTGCARGGAQKTVSVSGSTTIFAVAQAAAEEFNKRNPDVKVTVQGGGSSAGIEAAITGAGDIGMSSRDLKDEELKAGLVEHIIAIDAIAIIVNPDNPIKKLTARQVRDIFDGKIANWRQVGGKDVPIVLVNRDEASGTREAFLKKVMEGKKFSKDAVIQPGSGQVRSIVASTPAAIGYMSLGYVTPEVKVIEYDGTRPSKESVFKGKYKLSRKLKLFTKGRAKGATKKFIDFFLGDWVQKNIVSVEFIPVRG